MNRMAKTSSLSSALINDDIETFLQGGQANTELKDSKNKKELLVVERESDAYKNRPSMFKKFTQRLRSMTIGVQ